MGFTTSDIFYENLKNKICERIGSVNTSGIEQLCLLEDKLVKKLNSPLNTLSDYLSEKFSFSK